MKMYKNIRGTMLKVPEIEVGVDTVYIRTNIREVVEDDFKGWMYDEIQYDKDNYIEVISDKNTELESALLEVVTLRAIKDMEIEDVILELTMMIGGGM